MNFLMGLFYFLFFRISSWMCSVPMWATLILHFTVGLPIYYSASNSDFLPKDK